MAVSPLTRIDRQITINAPIERVFRALTDAAELSSWFQVRIEGTLSPNRDVWMTSVHPDHAGQRFRVRIAAVEPPRRLVWQWHPGEVDPNVDYSREPMTTVTFTLEPSNGGTRLTVSETGFDEITLARRAKVYQDNSQGWAEVLVWLQRHVQQAR
jgi:uncharacterized protein YndB with AHSA1/START domain